MRVREHTLVGKIHNWKRGAHNGKSERKLGGMSAQMKGEVHVGRGEPTKEYE